MTNRALLFAAMILVASACSDESASTRLLPSLPEAVTNNAVASVATTYGEYLVSFAGIGSGLEHDDIHARSFVLGPSAEAWQEVTPIPGKEGRLAATATSVGELAYVFGGYSVAADGNEVSTPWTHSFDPRSGEFVELAPMPVPVDDAVSVTYENRYIYLISGWHDLGNVNLVQRFDTETNRWSQATPIPGLSLFGHAGAIVGNSIVYCDGVFVQAHDDRPRSFAASKECWLGSITDSDSRRIDWRSIEAHPGLPRYRMASAGLIEQNAVVFVGGSENPYNFNAIGYNGEPAEPASGILRFDLQNQQWSVLDNDASASMDHRGLVPYDDRWYTVGGMLANQQVSDAVPGYAFNRK